MKNSTLRRVILPALTTLAMAMAMSSASAARVGDDYLIQWDDGGVNLIGNTYKNGVLIQSINFGPNGYSGGYGLWAGVLSDSVDWSVNAYGLGAELGVTWHLFGNAGDQVLGIPFHADHEPGPLLPLDDPDLTLTITGNWQTVLEFNDSTGDHYTWEFRSQVVAVPEPETYALMLGGLGVMAWVARRRKA